jgi:hypothetical protein
MTDKAGHPAITAFEESAAALRQQLAHAKLKPEEFQRKLSRCSLNNCHGMCCYGGVSVDVRTASVLLWHSAPMEIG